LNNVTLCFFGRTGENGFALVDSADKYSVSFTGMMLAGVGIGYLSDFRGSLGICNNPSF
jgi:hypothetical protein